jgi:hypothetical protein
MKYDPGKKVEKVWENLLTWVSGRSIVLVGSDEQGGER